MKKLIVTSLFLITIICCNKKAEEKIETTTPQPQIVDIAEAKTIDTTIANGDTSQNALDWNGTYTGTLPCANCDGIKTQITLTKSLTYTTKQEFLAKEKKTVIEKGTFSWSNNGSTITTLSIDKSKKASYKVGENILIALDEKGNEIKNGNKTSNYILSKM